MILVDLLIIKQKNTELSFSSHMQQNDFFEAYSAQQFQNSNASAAAAAFFS